MSGPRFGNSRLQAVTFDVGGTLIDPWPSVGHVYAATAAEHGFGDYDPEWLNRRFAAVWRSQVPFDYTRPSWAEIVAQTFGLAVGPSEELSFFPDLYERFARPETWRIYDDVQPALERLRQRGIRTAVISNWDERLRPLLQALKLDRFFEVVAVSSELGAHKPSAAIFENVLRRLNLPGEAVLHVGDSALEDIEGAQRAGLRAIRLQRRSQTRAAGEIVSLIELEKAVTR